MESTLNGVPCLWVQFFSKSLSKMSDEEVKEIRINFACDNELREIVNTTKDRSIQENFDKMEYWVENNKMAGTPLIQHIKDLDVIVGL